jgi:prefoldin beta subunit
MTEQDRKIREIQMLEQNFQNLLMQKQAFQMELSENSAALDEIQNSGDEIYKIIGQLMIKSEKSKVQKELESKKKILELRMKNIEEQEKAYTEKLQRLQKEALKEMKK